MLIRRLKQFCRHFSKPVAYIFIFTDHVSNLFAFECPDSDSEFRSPRRKFAIKFVSEEDFQNSIVNHCFQPYCSILWAIDSSEGNVIFTHGVKDGLDETLSQIFEGETLATCSRTRDCTPRRSEETSSAKIEDANVNRSHSSIGSNEKLLVHPKTIDPRPLENGTSESALVQFMHMVTFFEFTSIQQHFNKTLFRTFTFGLENLVENRF